MYSSLLGTANIIYNSLQFILHRCAINICNKLHVDPWSKDNTISQPNKMKAYCFDIKTSVNETKQQSTWLKKSININHQSGNAPILGLLYQTLVSSHTCLHSDCWTIADVMLRSVTGKHAHGLHLTQWSFEMQYNIQSVAASCRFANDVYMNYVAYSTILL
jgi:hypothetical protein